MQATKVLIFSRQFPREGNKHAGIFILQQAKSFLRYGCEVKVLSPIPWFPPFLSQYAMDMGFHQTSRKTELDGIEVDYPRYLRPPLGHRSHQITPYLLSWGIHHHFDEIVKSYMPTVIHAHWALPEGFSAIKLAKRYSIPVIVNLRGSDIHTLPYLSKRLHVMTSEVLTQADSLVAVSNSLRKQAKDQFNLTQPIKVVYNGCDVKQFQQNWCSRGEIRNRFGISDRHILLLYVGSILPAKGMRELVEVIGTILLRRKDVRLMLIGIGKYQKRMKELVHQAGLSEYVHFVGSVKHEKISDWLSAGDIFVFPSYKEGLPNAVLEAMACELPVVATKVGGIPEAVREGKTGYLVAPKDVAGLVEAIEKLIRDPDYAQKMGKNGRQRVLDEFSWDQHTEKMMALYRSCIQHES